jgi:hypothetical protein
MFAYRCDESAGVAANTVRSFIRFGEMARSCAGMASGAAPLSRSARIDVVV